MEISFKTRKIERVCTDFSEASRQHGIDTATIIHKRMKELRAADSIETMLRFKIGRCHKLIGERTGQFALDLQHPHRLIFKSVGMTAVQILEFVDYH